MRAPALLPAIAWMLGVTVGWAWPISPELCWGGVVVSLGLAVFALRRRWLIPAGIAVCLTLTCLAALRSDAFYRQVPADSIVTWTGQRPQLARVRGTVISLPSTYSPTDPSHLGYSPPPRTRFLLDASAILTRDGWRETTGTVRVRVNEPVARLGGGTRVELIGRMGRYPPPENPGEYDAAARARLTGQRVWFTVPVGEGVVRRGPPPRAWERISWNVRTAGRIHFTPRDAQGSRIATALVIGERHPALRSLSRLMVRAGVAHLLSISGLHLGVFLAFVYVLSRLAMQNRRVSAAIVLVVLGAYLLVAQPRVPLMRSAIMAGMLCGAVLLRRPRAVLNALAVAALVVLIVDPLQLVQPGFQLSFAIVAGLVLFHRRLRRFLFGRWLRRRGLTVSPHTGRWGAFRRRVADVAMDTVTASLLAYAIAAPLVAYHFGVFSPYAAVLGIILLPWVGAVLVPGYLSLALTAWAPNLAWQLGLIARRAGRSLAWVMEQVDRLPAAGVELQPVHWMWVVGWYLVGAAVVFRRTLPAGRWIAPAGAVCMVVWSVVGQLPAGGGSTAQLYVASVGDGQCSLLRCPAGPVVVLDAGAMAARDVGRSTLLPMMRQLAMPAPTAAFVSHANSDHYNALPALLDAGGIRRVYVSEHFGRDWTNPSRAAEQLLRKVRQSGAKLVRLSTGDVVELDDRTRVEVLWPSTDPNEAALRSSENNRSLVLRVVCDGASVLLPGDIDAAVQHRLMGRPTFPRSDVLLLPHHGAYKPTLQRFVVGVDPHISLASTSRELRSHSAAGRALVRWLKTERLFYSTAQDGCLRVEFAGPEVRVLPMRNVD
ncbi:MAG: ComEC/Rec2 family competence protein [Phycisphaerae bacterium]